MRIQGVHFMGVMSRETAAPQKKKGGFAMLETRYHHDTEDGQRLHIAYGILA